MHITPAPPDLTVLTKEDLDLMEGITTSAEAAETITTESENNLFGSASKFAEQFTGCSFDRYRFKSFQVYVLTHICYTLLERWHVVTPRTAVLAALYLDVLSYSIRKAG